jgi:hypothetical protein
MTTHNSVAKSVREHKEKHPELYCPKCLWKTGGGFCFRHAPNAPDQNANMIKNGLDSWLEGRAGCDES